MWSALSGDSATPRLSARFGGASAPGRIVLGASPYFEAMRNTVAGRAPRGFALRLWVATAGCTQARHGLVSFGGFDLLLHLNVDCSEATVELRLDGTSHFSVPFPFYPDEWTKLGVDVNTDTGTVHVGYGQSLGASGWLPRIPLMELGGIAGGPRTVGDISLGQALGDPTTTLDGWLDDVMIYDVALGGREWK